MSWFIRTLGTWQGRLVSGLASMTAVAVAATSAASPRVAVAAKIILFIPVIPTIAAWITATITGGNDAHPHDVRLFQRIMELISPDERYFLRTQDFGHNFALSRLAGVREISHWHGTSYEFLNHGLQKQWKFLKERIDRLCELVALTTSPLRGNPGLQTVYPTSVDPEDPPECVKLEIDALNDAATAVIKGLDLFEPFARRKLFV